jgi:hypothetical protein
MPKKSKGKKPAAKQLPLPSTGTYRKPARGQRFLSDDLQEAFSDPLRHIDPLRELSKALEAVGIDPQLPAQPDPALRDQWPLATTARTQHSELVALAVEHANDARKLAASRARTDREAQGQSNALRDLVLATMARRRDYAPPEGSDDERSPLLMDGEIICLATPQDDTRSTLLTVKIPRLVIDRLRDAVAALAPHRTMAGIVTLGVQLVLDVLEAEHLKQTGRRFPRKPGRVLEGGKPSRTRATTAQEAPRATTGRKKPTRKR